MFSLQVMSILAPQKYIDNKEEVLFARSPIPNFLNYLRRRRRGKESTKPIDDDDVDVLDDDTAFGIDDSFDFAQFVRTHGHRIDHMIKKCRWKSQPCGPENFTAVITEFGLCYTFNSGEYQTWGRGGSWDTLKLFLKVISPRYLTFEIVERFHLLGQQICLSFSWNKRKFLYERRIQSPQDFFGTPIWPPWGHMKTNLLRWLSTVLRAVSGNSRYGSCFKLDKQTCRRKKAMVHRWLFLKIY